MKTPQRVLVTGAAGFIGRCVVNRLVDDGHVVRALVRRHCAQLPAGVEQTIVEDIADARWEQLLIGADSIVHLAGIAHTRGVADSEYERVNIAPARALAQAASSQRIVFMSSIRAAGQGGQEPSDSYGRSKRAAEEALLALHPSACILRPVPVYGAGARYNMRALELLARSRLPLPLGSFDAPLSLVSVQNVASAVSFALGREAGGAFVLSDPGATSLRAVLHDYRQALGRSALLIKVPPQLLRKGAQWVGREPLYETLMQPSLTPPHGLLAAGWSPVHQTTGAGMREWAQR